MAQDILVVDDELDICVHIAGLLKDEGYIVRTTNSSEGAISSLKERVPNLLILDVWLGKHDQDGLYLLEKVREKYPFLPVLMISGHGTIEMAVKAIKLGAYDFIEKPFELERLLLSIERAMESYRLREENNRLRNQIEVPLIGNALSFTQLMTQVGKIAATNSRILIHGAYGSGNEVVARDIHVKSKRNGGQFITLNCAVMNSEEIEKALFGWEAEDGALHGAGLAEKANGGTLFLQEVTALSLPIQAKLVRMLQNNGFIRVGGDNKVEVDVRVIASTSKDIKALIDQQLFREDLYYRLGVVSIFVPSLKERREDIMLLTKYFLNTMSAHEISIKEDAVAVLESYSWPGNIMQLKNVLENILFTNPDLKEINAAMLPGELLQVEWADKDRWAELMSLPLKEARELFEKNYLSAQMQRFSYNVTRIAKKIHMERSALHRKLKTLGLQNHSAEVAKAAGEFE